MNRKTYILDTNVLLHDCQSILKFEENNIILPMTVLEEIDRKKKEMNELGMNARHFSHMMDEFREIGSLKDGVQINNQGGILKIVFCTEEVKSSMPSDTDWSVDDNKIIAVALYESRLKSNFDTIIVSMDTNVRVKADALGLKAETYENGAVNFDTLYTGKTKVYIDNMDNIDLSIYNGNFSANQFVEYILNSDESIKQTYRFDKILGTLVPLINNIEPWGFIPRNDEQKYALELLLNDDIKLVTLVGKAGTGKTICAIAAALHKTTEEFIYRKTLVSRPVFPMGKDIGFLPGEISEKLAPYMQPIYDNVEVLMTGYSANGCGKPKIKIPKKRLTAAEKLAQKQELEKEEGSFGESYKELIAAGIMQIEPLLYIRGRSIPNQILIVDEAQNLTPHEMKTILTRAGEGCKIIVTGDPYQIDNPYVDASSNGLTYIVERFKDEAISGHVTMTIGERSELAEISSNIL